LSKIYLPIKIISSFNQQCSLTIKWRPIMKKVISLFLIVFALQTIFCLTVKAKTIDCKINENYQLWEKSKRVKVLQICLSKNGYKLRIDSIYGKKTDNVKQAYIQKNLLIKQKNEASPAEKATEKEIQMPSSKKIIKFLVIIFIFIIFIFSNRPSGYNFHKKNKSLLSTKFNEKGYYPDNCKAWSLRNGAHDVRDLPDYDRRN